MRHLSRFVQAVSCCALAFAALPAAAVTFDWAGTVTFVNENTGGGVFNAAGLGAMFDGSVSYPDTCAATCSPGFEADEADYAFFGAGIGGDVNHGGLTESGPFVYVNIQDDRALDADEAALASLLFGATVNEGTLVDVWTVGVENEEVLFDDLTGELLAGGFYEVFFVSFDTTLFDDLSYRPDPPALGDVDFAGFNVAEADNGVLLYDVFGELKPVPEPGLLWLVFATGFAVVKRRH